VAIENDISQLVKSSTV